MPDLYTVTLRKKTMISKYAPDGTKIGEDFTYTNTEIRDLPARTVETYRRTFPDNFVSSQLQAPQPSSRKTKIDTGYKTKGSGRPASVKTDDQLERKQAHKTGGDYADVINEMMQEVA